MLPYSLRLALRHFARKKIYSSIIVLSLTVGFACTCLLVSFLIGEGNVDSFHRKRDRLFELVSNDPFGGTGRINYTTGPTRDYMIDTYGEVENICQITDIARSGIDIGGNITPLVTIGVDTSFFTMFDFPLIAGSKKDIANGLMITAEKAERLFGTQDVLGRFVSLHTPDSVKLIAITGVVGKPAEKSHIAFEGLVAHSLLEPMSSQQRPGGVSYMLLRNGTDPIAFNEKINKDKSRPTLLAPGEMDYFLEPIQKAYTHTWNRQPFIQTRSEMFISVGWIVCGLILSMAAFNFVNLFLLSIQERRKQLGIQKTLGISLWQIIRNATTEGGFYIMISFVLSLILAYLLMPVFNSALDAGLQPEYFSKLQVFSLMGGLLLLIAFIVIIASTIQQRRTLPVSMMKNVTAKVKFSKLFFTLQFFVSITLCICSVTIIKQMKFVETAPLGFNRNMIQLNLPGNESVQRLGDLKTRLSKLPGVEHVAQSTGNPISGNMMMMIVLDDGRHFNPYLFAGDEDLIKTLNLELVEGRLDLQAGDKIVNETLIKFLDMKDPIGMKIPGTNDGQIVGVVKDFTCSSFKTEMAPVIISYQPDAKNLLIDYGQNDLDALLPKIRGAWTDTFANDYFDFRIIQQDLMKKYSEESLFYKIVLAASITSMIISCFGLFALSWAVIRSRAKEMGIRKVLGASVADVLGLLTATFAKRLLLAFILAAPMGYYLMNLWLSRFVYKAPIDSWVFVLTGVALATIAVVTLGFQTLKASLSSPLEEIRE